MLRLIRRQDQVEKMKSQSMNSNLGCTGSKAIIITDNSNGGRSIGGKLKSIICGSLDKGKSTMIYSDNQVCQ